MRVYLDDLRLIKPGYDTLCRTAHEAIEAIASGKVKAISLDNDLGTKLEGSDVFNFLEDQVRTLQIPLPSIRIHTSNRSAGDAMERGAKNLLRWYVTNVDAHTTATVEREYREPQG